VLAVSKTAPAAWFDAGQPASGIGTDDTPIAPVMRMLPVAVHV